MKKVFFCVLLASLISFTSCFPTGDSMITPPEFNSDDTNSSVNSKLKFDFSVPNKSFSECSVLKATRKIWEEDVVENIFLSYMPENTPDSPAEESLYYPGKCNYKCFECDDFIFAYDAGMILFLSDNCEKYDYSTLNSYYQMVCSEKEMRKIFPKDTLSSFSPDNAIKQMNEILAELSIDTEESPEVYALDSETVNNLQFDVNWTNEADAYMIVQKQTFDGIEFSPFDSHFEGSDKPSCSSYICGIFSSRGLEYFQCTNCLDNIEIVDSVNVCPAETAISAVKNHMNNIFSENLVEESDVTGCDLLYVNTEVDEPYTYTFKPYWLFTQRDVFGSDMTDVYDGIFVDVEDSSIW